MYRYRVKTCEYVCMSRQCIGPTRSENQSGSVKFSLFLIHQLKHVFGAKKNCFIETFLFEFSQHVF